MLFGPSVWVCGQCACVGVVCVSVCVVGVCSGCVGGCVDVCIRCLCRCVYVHVCVTCGMHVCCMVCVCGWGNVRQTGGLTANRESWQVCTLLSGVQ